MIVRAKKECHQNINNDYINEKIEHQIWYKKRTPESAQLKHYIQICWGN